MKQLLIIFLFIPYYAFCQHNGDILKAQELKEGVYANFREFRTNSPSIVGQIEFKENSEAARMLVGANKNKLYIIDSVGNRKRLKKQIWGFCDGEYVYIFWDKSPSLRRYFNKLITIDRYCIFLDDGYSSSGASFNNFSVPVFAKYEIDYILNINNGITYKVNNKLMKVILAKDPELLKKYKSEKNRRSKRLRFIRDFCVRNPDQIKTIKL